MYKAERDAFEEEMREIGECNMEELGTLESSEKTIDILGDRWWPQVAKQERDNISRNVPSNIWKTRNERPNVGGCLYLE